MSFDRGILRRRGWRKLAWLFASLVFCFAAVIVFFPNSLLNQRVASGLTNYLVSRLGPEAICDEVELGFRHISLHNVLLPLGDDGTMLSISRIDARVDPLTALSQPGEYARILQSVNIVSPELIFRLPKGTGGEPAGGEIPVTLFEALESVDSLRSLTFESGKVTILVKDSILFRLHDLRGGITHASDGFNIAASGWSEIPTKLELRLDGQVSPARRELRLETEVELASGEVALKIPPLDLAAMNGGTAHARVQQISGRFSIEADLSLDDLELRVASQSIYFPDATLSLREGVVAWDSLLVRGLGTSALTSGTLDLNDSLRLVGLVSADAELAELLKSFAIRDSSIRGKVEVAANIGGYLTAPVVTATVRSEELSIKGQPVDSVLAQAEFRDSTLSVLDCKIWSEIAYARTESVVEFGTEITATVGGELYPGRIPKLLGQTSTLQRVEFALSSRGASLDMRWLARDGAGVVLGNGTAAQLGSHWNLQFYDPNGRAGAVDIENQNGDWSVSASNAHIVVPIVYPGTANLLGTVEELEFAFAGDDESGTSKLSIQSDSTVKSAFGRVIENLDFDGTYEKSADGKYDFAGSWHGISGEGEEFFGKGDVQLDQQQLTIANLYVDEAGSLSGTVRIDSPFVDLNMSIEQLPLSRIPFVAGFADRWRLGGVLSGEMSAVGPTDSVRWYSDLSLVDGEAQGVPGYWGLLTAEGVGERVESLHSTFGRGVKSIFEATGSLDLSRDEIDLRAEFTTSDCADLIQATSGRRGILSGDLDGEILIFGKLSSPEAVASLRVVNGELLGELAVDRFALDATLTTESDGSRLLAVPQLSFEKQGKYEFSGELSAEPMQGGPFRAYFAGTGDFLDMLQQVDADFTSLGSDAKLIAEVGGTWDKPRFVGGELRVTQGSFTYPPAAPGTLVMNTLLRLNSEGRVDSGRIQVNEGEDYLRVDLIGTEDPRSGMRTPLVIPSPRIELGIIYLSTSENGIAVRLPGFMKPDWLGQLTTGANGLEGIAISAFDSTRLRISGQTSIRDARFTFPFLSYGGRTMRPVTRWLVQRLYETWWDLGISMGSGSHYDVEITGFKDSELFSRMGNNPLLGTVADYLDHISVDAIVTPTETPLIMEGSIVDSTLRLDGKLGATSGSADYLDQTFWIEKLQAEFDETDIFPIISGRSATYGVDSVGRTVPVYLTIYEIDEETDTRAPFGRFEDVTYVLEADGYPDQEQVLALLGYDFTNLSQGKAEQLLTRTALTAAKRIWLDPISRRLERATFLDEISLTPGGGASASIFRQQKETVLRDTLESSGAVRFLTGSNVTVGKYLSKDLFVTYTGELAEAAGEIEGGRLGLIHYWNLQYRVDPVSPDFVLDFAVEYDEASRRRDESVALKYSFVLEP